MYTQFYTYMKLANCQHTYNHLQNENYELLNPIFNTATTQLQ